MKMPFGSPWPLGIILTFVTLAIFDGVIVFKAISSDTGSVERNPYEAGLSYDKIIKGRTETQRAGVKAALKLSSKGVTISLEKFPPNTLKTVQVALIKPNDPAADRKFEATGTADAFELSTVGVAPGLWLTQTTVTSLGRTYVFDSREVAAAE